VEEGHNDGQNANPTADITWFTETDDVAIVEDEVVDYCLSGSKIDPATDVPYGKGELVLAMSENRSRIYRSKRNKDSLISKFPTAVG
jgi:hypothetical protein